MIREVERYHGAILARLIRDGGPAIRCGVHPCFRSAYVLEDRVAVYVKYSTSRLSPWTFRFKPEHRKEIRKLCEDFDGVFVGLVCGIDGVACLGTQEYFQVEASGSVRVARGRRQKYAVSSGDSEGILRVGNKEFPAKVYEAIRGAAKRREQVRGEAAEANT